MMIEGTVSITVPTRRSSRLINRRKTHGLSLSPVKVLARSRGISRRARIQPYTVEVAMMNMTTPVPTPVVTRTSGRCRH